MVFYSRLAYVKPWILGFAFISLVMYHSAPSRSRSVESAAGSSQASADFSLLQTFNPFCAVFNGSVEGESFLSYTEHAQQFQVYSRNVRLPSDRYHFAVMTSPKNHLQRRAIRNTWKKFLENHGGDQQCSASLRFYVGQTASMRIAHRLEKEVRDNPADMVYIGFCDTYENLPLKTFNVMSYIDKHAPESLAWVVKIDDDVMPNLAVFFKCFPSISTPDAGIYGWITGDRVPEEDYEKYRIPRQRYNKTWFPAFAHGPAYVLRTSDLSAIIQSANLTPIINLEDVWFTGISAEKAGIKRHDIPQHIIGGAVIFDFQQNKHNSRDKSAFFYHGVGFRILNKWWPTVTSCCDCWKHCETFRGIRPKTKAPAASQLILDTDW